MKSNQLGFTLRNLLTIADLSQGEIETLLAVAAAFLKIPPEKTPPLLKNQIIANLFFENSTRTRISFEQATRRLGGQVMNFTASSSSLSKGENLLDTIRTLMAMNPNCFVIRHRSAGAADFISRKVKIPVVNAGDGIHEHPTQALLDALTIQEKLGSINDKKVLIVGDLSQRVATSNIHLLSKLGAVVSVCGPPTLIPTGLKNVQVHHHLNEPLQTADVVIMLRIQLERHKGPGRFPSLSEYHQFWGLSREREKLLKPDAIILHPGPVNRGVEISSEVADGEKSQILKQVTHGVFARMAVLAALCNPKGLGDWMKEGGHHVD